MARVNAAVCGPGNHTPRGGRGTLRVLLAVVLLGIAAPTVTPAQTLNLSTGYVYVGPVVNEVTHRVRVGNRGQELYLGVGAEGRLSRRTAVVGKLVLIPSYIHVWPCEMQPCNGMSRWRWESRPGLNSRADAFLWSSVNLGVAYRPVSWASIGGGASITTLSMCRHQIWGACPMHAPGLYVDLHVDKQVDDRLRIGLELGTSAVAPRDGRFTALAEWAGAKEYTVDAPHGGEWILPVWIGASVHFGNDRPPPTTRVAPPDAEDTPPDAEGSPPDDSGRAVAPRTAPATPTSGHR